MYKSLQNDQSKIYLIKINIPDDLLQTTKDTSLWIGLHRRTGSVLYPKFMPDLAVFKNKKVWPTLLRLYTQGCKRIMKRKVV